MTRPEKALGTPVLAAMALLAVVSLVSVARCLQTLEELAPASQAAWTAVDGRVATLERRLRSVERCERLQKWIGREIRRANPGLEVEEVRAYSQLLLEITDKYNSLDPLFLLAVGIVESHFETRATSGANARGLYQIWPATGRWLASELDWSFSEAMLYDPEKNTELAALYLDKLFASYGDPRLVLAEYNGGPVNARRLREGSDRLASETRDYVVEVMNVLDGLHRRFDLPSAFDHPHRDSRVAWLAPLRRGDAVAD